MSDNDYLLRRIIAIDPKDQNNAHVMLSPDESGLSLKTSGFQYDNNDGVSVYSLYLLLHNGSTADVIYDYISESDVTLPPDERKSYLIAQAPTSKVVQSPSGLLSVHYTPSLNDFIPERGLAHYSMAIDSNPPKNNYNKNYSLWRKKERRNAMALFEIIKDERYANTLERIRNLP